MQLGMKAGVKVFGQKVVDAVFKEVKMFYDRKVVKPILPDKITPKVRRYALGYLMFLKEKWNGDIKGRGCDDGLLQRLYKSKEETALPTVNIIYPMTRGQLCIKYLDTIVTTQPVPV